MTSMIMLVQPPTTAVSTSGRISITSPHYPRSDRRNPSLFAHRRHRKSPNRLRNPLSVDNSEAGGGSSATKSVPPPQSISDDSGINGVDVVGDENVPLEGVIQFDKPKYSNFSKWSRVALLAGGDVVALLLFSAIGRFSHGFSVYDAETLRTADPFIAGWLLSAYFLGGYGEDGRGINGYSNAVIAAAKSWALGIPPETSQEKQIPKVTEGSGNNKEGEQGQDKRSWLTYKRRKTMKEAQTSSLKSSSPMGQTVASPKAQQPSLPLDQLATSQTLKSALTSPQAQQPSSLEKKLITPLIVKPVITSSQAQQPSSPEMKLKASLRSLEEERETLQRVKLKSQLGFGRQASCYIVGGTFNPSRWILSSQMDKEGHVASLEQGKSGTSK